MRNNMNQKRECVEQTLYFQPYIVYIVVKIGPTMQFCVKIKPECAD